ncbi:MAG TPA: choice-of-anchor Q domain-containing protein, partial [Verrucomicrobiae bacterium]
LGLVFVASFFKALVSDLHASVIQSCDQNGVQTAVANGGSYTFDCDANVILTSTLVVSNDLVLDGNGHNVSINGNNSFRIFKVLPGVHLTLVQLKLINGTFHGTNGAAGSGGQVGMPIVLGQNGEPGSGAAIYSDSAIVNLQSCTFSNNLVYGGTGGAGFPSSTNTAGAGGHGKGGAIFLRSGALVASDCLFSANQAIGGSPGGNVLSGLAADPGDSYAGAIASMQADLRLTNAIFNSNSSRGYNAPGSSYQSGGNSFGGSVYCEGGTLTCLHGEFIQNSCVAGSSGVYGCSGGAYGGAVYLTSCSGFFLEGTFRRNAAIATTSGKFCSRANAYGGSIFNAASSSFFDCTFDVNSVQSGPAPNVGKDAAGGGIYNANICVLSRCLISSNSCAADTGFYNGPSAGVPSNGGNAFGGGIFSQASLFVTNCTFYRNTIRAGNGTTGPQGIGGVALGGGICNTGGIAYVMNASLSENSARGGFGRLSTVSLGAAIGNTNGTVTIWNTILATSKLASNAYGGVVDGGYNLSSDASCAFTNSGSINNSDPLFGPLQNNGGLTLSLGLTDCSPALDAGNPVIYPPTDQRGIPRPIGSASDMGACEGIITWYRETFTFNGSALQMKIFGKPNQTFVLSAGPEPGNWSPILTNSIGVNCFYTYSGTNDSKGFFKIEFH